jgi:hypothetical protein
LRAAPALREKRGGHGGRPTNGRTQFAGESRGDEEAVIREAIEARREVELRALEDALAVGRDLRVHAEQAVSEVVDLYVVGPLPENGEGS